VSYREPRYLHPYDEAPASRPIPAAHRARVHEPGRIEIEGKRQFRCGANHREFADFLTPEQRISNYLATRQADRSAPTPTSSSCPTSARGRPVDRCDQELQSKGYKVPDYPENPKNDAEKPSRRAIRRYWQRVNPVLREGNSTGALPRVKRYARKIAFDGAMGSRLAHPVSTCMPRLLHAKNRWPCRTLRRAHGPRHRSGKTSSAPRSAARGR